MIRHMVLLRWSQRPSDDELEAIAAALDALPAAIDVIRSYEHGPDLGLAETNVDYGITATFDHPDDVAVYRDHPQHQAFIADHLTGRVAERVAVQIDLR
jgi:hypothetical protein